LGIFSPLNADLSLGLGFELDDSLRNDSNIRSIRKARKTLKPLIVHKVTDREGNVLIENITLDMFFEKDLAPIEAEYEEKRVSYLQSLKSG
jgi:membrane peptidoglycan carboxypeptidase